MPVEAAYAAKYLDENFLRQIRSLVAVLHRPRQQRVDRLMVARDEPRKRFFGTCLQFLDECCFFGLNRQRAGQIAHGEVRLHFSVLPRISQQGHLLHLEEPAPEVEYPAKPLNFKIAKTLAATTLRLLKNRRRKTLVTGGGVENDCRLTAGGPRSYCVRHRDPSKSAFPVTESVISGGLTLEQCWSCLDRKAQSCATFSTRLHAVSTSVAARGRPPCS